MIKNIKVIAKWALIALGTVAGLLVASFFALNSAGVQGYLKDKAVEMLTEELQTHVAVKHARVDVLSQYVALEGVRIDDREGRPMFVMELLKVDFRLAPLMHNEVSIKNVNVTGLQAQLYKPHRDSVANYQFVIDAFKKDQKEQKEQKADTATKKKSGEQLTLNLRRVRLNRIGVKYNDTEVSLQKLSYNHTWNGKHEGTLSDVHAKWSKVNKKGENVEHQVHVGTLEYREKKGQRLIDIDGLHFTTDNHRPRKNAGKPKRGFFDVGHFDVTARLKLVIDSVGKDNVSARLTECTAQDPTAGIDITRLTAHILANKDRVSLSNVVVAQKQTRLNIGQAEITLPKKDSLNPRHLSYSTSLITGRAYLRDISRTFAPVLSHFNEPLDLQLRMKGNDQSMQFRDILVSTADKKLKVKASGHIDNLKNKYKLDVHFDIHQMTAQKGVPQRIINQFVVKKFMMEQLDRLGTITYNGHLDVLWKKEQFAGRLHTQVGNLQFGFHIDEINKYVIGKASTQGIALDKLFYLKDIGVTACEASFKFDISKPRTAKMRRLKGGKLPIGSVEAHVDETQYKFVKVKNLFITMESDGAVAEGKLESVGKRVDMMVYFSFTNTSEMQKMKIRPGIRFHKMTDEDKEKRDSLKAAKKQQKAEEKALRKQQRTEEKALRKQQKAEEKALRKQQKAEEKARRAAEKAAKKASEAN